MLNTDAIASHTIDHLRIAVREILASLGVMGAPLKHLEPLHHYRAVKGGPYSTLLIMLDLSAAFDRLFRKYGSMISEPSASME